ncbi:MAG: phosphoglycerate kinase [Candidatus Yanofskybacteria bacterium CG10_big_fil_rev_8_21_14_0_10_36_16]|uniref:Phosphoglycerate kinase n=1 Tax=Candidatus Yanofskybacteria bacterium CG10_big_fil_rev_8_21_14_0_10_36_16 TaxID=1975096 RepID=A0A2J0Q9W3_9BACT|nr:MAG: phosphoglycerate kinase [Candidatus Yanofskybacteria bacterium CG10_big_fil_rev_8_21_14_0_10_36_16]
MKTINALNKNDLNGKKVLLRVDFDVPVVSGKILESFRIESQKPMVDYLIENGANVVMCAHISSIDSFESIVSQIGDVLKHEIKFLPLNSLLGDEHPVIGGLVLADNLRQNLGEKENSKDFAEKLASGFDLYVNNAFAVCHREHASVSAITEFLPSYGGLLIEKEIKNLGRALSEPAEGKTLVLGGAKISTKLPVINNFFEKSEKILVGGALANNFFLQILGIDIGASVVDNKVKVEVKSEKIILPEDVLIGYDKKGEKEVMTSEVEDVGEGGFIADLGPKSAQKFSDIIKSSKMVIWNGPLGFAEVEKFSHGTNIVAKAIAESGADSIIGGGDTITAVNKLGLLDKYSYVSTGGGAMLSFLAGEKLPGLEALDYYKS